MAETSEQDQFYPYDATRCSYVRELSDYWFSLGGQGGLPLVGDFDPVEFPQHAPWMVISDILNDGADFRFRLVGTKAVRILGGDLTGKQLSEEGKNNVKGRLRRIYAQVLSTGGPVWGGGRVGADEGRDGFDSEACILPLAGETGQPVRLVHMIRLRTDDGEWLT